MAITYSWEVESLITKTVDSNDKTVLQVSALRVAVDSDTGSVAKSSEAAFFDEDEIDLETLTPFSSLTEEAVIGWLETYLREDTLDIIDSRLAHHINDKNVELTSSKTNNTPPWA